MIYEDSTSSFDALLEKDMSFSVHNKNIQQLALEMYKKAHGLTSSAISSLFSYSSTIGTQDHNQIQPTWVKIV